MSNYLHLGALGILTALLAFGPWARGADRPAALPRPLNLEAAITNAIGYNPALQRTRERIKEQEGVLIEVKSAQLPNLSAQGSAGKSDKDLLESPLYEDSQWKVTVSASQVLYAGGRVRAQIRGQREQLEAAKLQYTAALNDTILLVRQQFYTVLLCRQLIAVHEEALSVLETELTRARNRQAAGTDSDFDVLRAEVAVANAKPPLIRARNDYRVSQDKLRATLGAEGGSTNQPTDLDVQGSLEAPTRELLLSDVLVKARAHRPEILQQERLLSAAAEGIAASRSGYFPTVSAVAGYEWTKPSLVSTPRNRLDGWTAGVQADWSIFDGRATAGRVAQARSRLYQAQHSAAELVLTIEVEVRQAHSGYCEAIELLTASDKTLSQARESLRIAKARFDAGTATQLDVLQAQSALTEANSNLAQARFSYVTALAGLERATGTP
ncbi:TolC family protein [Opitutaceae bacterium EW11]|nr:TolC family protein [Opitutaceae bacterium EW11]